MAIQSGGGLLALLVMAHFLGDFGLQSDRMAVEKCPGCDRTLPWPWWLTAHAAIHGVIDLFKCRGRYSLAVDQLLHLICKLLWALLASRWLALPLL
jgi:hypothetical protein